MLVVCSVHPPILVFFSISLSWTAARCLQEPLSAPNHRDVSQAQQTKSSVFYNPDCEESRNSSSTSSALSNSTFRSEIVNGLRHVDVNLDARLLPNSDPQGIWVSYKCCLFCLLSTLPSLPTILLRIYGSSSGSLISRSHELHTLHVLSSRYHIGPRIYGTFSNGRIEEYFDSVTLGPSDLRDENITRWIGSRMAELHSVEITAIEGPLSVRSLEGKSWEIGVKKNVRTWLPVARKVLAHPNVDMSERSVLNLDAFLEGWVRYLRWLSQVEKVEGFSRRVFAHNDTQYGNLLRLTGKLAEGTPEHRQLVVVDFEYASPNPLAFDIANHFHEWTADYHSSTPHLLDFSRYPTPQQRRNFYQAYLSHTHTLQETSTTDVAGEARLAKLDRQVRVWSPASHGMWAIWGIVQAKDDVEKSLAGTAAEFDYLGYAKYRMQRFFHEIAELGV
ncbi:kinase-like domain-containing protein [Boletus reticuloceps]|uniref:Kinase-like domain-containing protein n=1 Tax=Boletus reticuloceps TaxID=495285 RepID=A0A8I2YZS0_9AGAM|nr:kinase-like domain-containing protein [Boletus reticuloceps]